jgi:hypothetical protein
VPEIKVPKLKPGTPARNQEASLATKIQQASNEELANEDVGLQYHGEVSRLQAYSVDEGSCPSPHCYPRCRPAFERFLAARAPPLRNHEFAATTSPSRPATPPPPRPSSRRPHITKQTAQTSSVQLRLTLVLTSWAARDCCCLRAITAS